MKNYLGTIYIIGKEKKFWISWFNYKGPVVKFTSVIIQANDYAEARDKMKKYTDECMEEARSVDNGKWLKDVEYKGLVSAQI